MPDDAILDGVTLPAAQTAAAPAPTPADATPPETPSTEPQPAEAEAQPQYASAANPPQLDAGVTWDTNALASFEETATKHIGLSSAQVGRLLDWFTVWAADYAERGEISHSLVERGFEVAKHRFKLTDEQERGLRDWYDSNVRNPAPASAPAAAQQRQQAEDVTLDSLRQRWGGEYDKKIDAARDVVQKHAGLVAALEESGLGDDPRVVKAFADMASGEENDEGITSAEARRRIDAVLRDDKHPYNNRSARGHKEAVARVSALYRIAYRAR